MSLRVLQVNKFLYRVGGAESYMFNLAEALKESNVDVAFWGMSDERNLVDDAFNSFSKPIDYHNQKLFRKLINSGRTIYSFANKRKIGVILDQFKPDIVHIHNYNFQLTPSILTEIKKRGIKIVQTIHDSQMVCPYHRLYNFQKKNICIKCVKGSFLNCVKDRCFDNSLLKSSIGYLESTLYHSADYYNKYIDLFISPSNFIKDLVKNNIRNEIRVLPNFISQFPIENEGDQNRKNEFKEYVLYFGRISEEKGIIQFLDYFVKLKRNLLIIGNGPLVDQIKKSEYIKYIGPKYGEDLNFYIKNSQYVICPAVGYENCPMTVIESLVNKVPVIAPNHSGFIELIDHGKDGYLIDLGQSESDVLNELKEILDQRLVPFENDKDSFEKKLNKFSKKFHLEQILKAYDDL